MEKLNGILHAAGDGRAEADPFLSF